MAREKQRETEKRTEKNRGGDIDWFSWCVGDEEKMIDLLLIYIVVKL